MALGPEIIDFIGLCFLHDANEIACVGQITIVQLEVGMLDVRVLVNVVYSLRVEQR